ncbi:MAG: HD domain-containing protein [Candidatus Hydrogenedentes bacterium]|nr:HD domain-containing protein [Candidatus Hydrogenedentota bacterium]
MPRVKHSKKGLIEIRRMARKLDPEPGHVFQVCKNALALFDATRRIHKLGAPDRRLLEAAALLHDIGHTIDVVAHHKHSRDIIMDMRLPGLSARRKRIVACVARYHRKAHPAGTHAVFCDLDKPDRRRVQKLAAILRIADGLDRSHVASCKRIAVEAAKDSVTINIEQRRPTPTDIWGAQRKQSLFEEVFKVRVIIQAIPDKRQSVPKTKASA